MNLLPPFFLRTNFSLFHISHLDMFLQTQNTTMKTKSKNKVTMLSFYTAKLKKVRSLNIRKKMVKKCDFFETFGHNKVCLKVIVLRISGYINHTLSFLLGPSKCLYIFFNFCTISFLVWICVSFGALCPHWAPYPISSLGIKHYTSTPYNLESQGIVEHMHQTLKSILKMSIDIPDGLKNCPVHCLPSVQLQMSQ